MLPIKMKCHGCHVEHIDVITLKSDFQPSQNLQGFCPCVDFEKYMHINCMIYKCYVYRIFSLHHRLVRSVYETCQHSRFAISNGKMIRGYIR